MSQVAAKAANYKQSASSNFENIFSNIQNKLSEFEEVKKEALQENEMLLQQNIKSAKDSINTALQTSEILSKQRERETQLLDQWLRIVKIQRETFKSNEVFDDEIKIPSFLKNYSEKENGLADLSNNLCNILRDIVTHKETPEATRLSQIYINAKNDYQSRSDLFEQITYDVFRAQSKYNTLTNENFSLASTILELQEYTNTFSDTSSYDAIQKAKKIKLARELAHAKEAIMNKQITEIRKEMEIYSDPQESYKMARKQICRNEREYRKKIGDYEKELILLKQEISDFSQNSTSLFSSLEKELENTRIAQLNNEKDQSDTQINQIKMIQERLLSKFQKDESDSAQNIETILKSNTQDPISPLTIDHQNAISRRKMIFPTLINDLREICQTSQKVDLTKFSNQMEIIRNNQQQKATALRSYLNRMKTDIFYRESEIATVKSQCFLVEDLTYDIMEIAIQLLGEYETNERIEERTSKRKEVEKLNNFISKGDHITRKLETFLNGRIEIAKEQLIVDGSFNNRPKSSMTKIEEKEFNKEIIFAENANQFTRYNYKTRTEMKKKKMVRIPLLINRRAPLTAADLEPDEFEVLHSSMKNDSFVISNGKVGFMKNGEFVEVDPSQFEGKSGYFKDGIFVPFDPENGIPEGLPDGTFVIVNGQPGYIKDGKFVPCDPNNGVIPDGTAAIVDGVEGIYINGKFVPNNENDMKDGTVAIVDGKKGVFKNGVFVPFDDDLVNNLLPPGAELAVVDGKVGYYDKDGNFVEINPDDFVRGNQNDNENDNKIPKNGIFIDGKFVPFDPENGIPENIPDGTFGIINGQAGVFKDGKFIPHKNGYIDSNGNFVEFNEEDGIPEDLPDGTVIVFKGKVGRIINGKFVPDEEEDNNENNKIPKNGIFIDGKFVPFDPENGIPDNIPDGTFGIINGQAGVFKDGKFIPHKNGYIDSNGNFVEFNEEDGIPEDLPDGTVIVFKGKVGRIINGKFVPDEDEEEGNNINGYFDENGNFIPFDGDLSSLPDGTTVVINGQTGIIKDGKFVPTDPSDCNIPQNGYFTKDGRFVPFDPTKGLPEGIPDGTVAIINGQLGIFKDGKFVPNKNNDDDEHKTGYFDSNGNFVAFNPDDGIPNVPDGTIGIVNGHRGIFKNGKFIPFEGNIFPEEEDDDENAHKMPNGYYDENGNFIPFDGEDIPFDRIPDGTVGFYKGKQGIFRDGKFIPFTDDQLNQSGSGYYDENGNFIPIDPNSGDFSHIPDGTFGVLNGQKGIFRNGRFIPFKKPGFKGGIGRPGYIDDDGNFVPFDPNDPNFPAGRKVVFMMNDGTIITQDQMRKLYPGLCDREIYNRLKYGRFKKHSITPYKKGSPDDDCDYEWFSKCPREDPDWIPDPLYRIQPLKFKFPTREKKVKPRPKPELTPEQIRALIANSPNIQFDPATSSLFANGRQKSDQVFGICNFKKSTKNRQDSEDENKSPRRGRPLATSYANGRRNQLVSKSTQPKRDPLYFIQKVEKKNQAKNILPPLNRQNSNDNLALVNNEDCNNNKRSFCRSSYDKMRLNADMTCDMKNPPLDGFKRRLFAIDEQTRVSPGMSSFKPRPIATKINNYRSEGNENINNFKPLMPSGSYDTVKASLNNDDVNMQQKIGSPRRLIDINDPKLIKPLGNKRTDLNKPRSPRHPTSVFSEKISNVNE